MMSITWYVRIICASSCFQFDMLIDVLGIEGGFHFLYGWSNLYFCNERFEYQSSG